MKSLITVAFVLMAMACVSVTVSAFVAPRQSQASVQSSTLPMAPRFDPASQRWSPATEEESAASSYPPIRSLLRHGPKAFFVRTTQPDNYDQAVLKFMAKEQCSRWEAQGNMDRYFENAQDWAFERYEAERTGRKLDYVTINQQQVVLSSVWAGIVVWYSNYLFHVLIDREYIQF